MNALTANERRIFANALVEDAQAELVFVSEKLERGHKLVNIKLSLTRAQARIRRAQEALEGIEE